MEKEIQQSADVFARGMLDTLKPIVEETDARVQAVFTAQATLQREIQRLSKELDVFAEQSQTPSLMPYVNKLAQAKHRMDNIHRILQATRDRLHRLERLFLSSPGVVNQVLPV